MQNDIKKKLFEIVSSQPVYEDPFTSTEIEVRMQQHRELLLDGNKSSETDDRFMELVDLLQYKAFAAGFDTAVTLLTR